MLGRAGANCQARGACAEERGVGHAERCPPCKPYEAAVSACGAVCCAFWPQRTHLAPAGELAWAGESDSSRASTQSAWPCMAARWRAVRLPQRSPAHTSAPCAQHGSKHACSGGPPAHARGACRRLSVRTAQAVRGACEQHDRLWACTHVAAVLRLPTMPGESLHRSRKGQGGSPGQPAGGRQRCGRARRPA